MYGLWRKKYRRLLEVVTGRFIVCEGGKYEKVGGRIEVVGNSLQPELMNLCHGLLLVLTLLLVIIVTRGRYIWWKGKPKWLVNETLTVE